MLNDFNNRVDQLNKVNQCSLGDIQGVITLLSYLKQKPDIIKTEKFKQHLEIFKNKKTNLSEKQLEKYGWSQEDICRYPVAIYIFNKFMKEIDDAIGESDVPLFEAPEAAAENAIPSNKFYNLRSSSTKLTDRAAAENAIPSNKFYNLQSSSTKLTDRARFGAARGQKRSKKVPAKIFREN